MSAPSLVVLSDVVSDRRPTDPGYKRAARKQRRDSRRRNLRLSVGDMLYTGFALAGWAATTALATAGLFVVLFFAAGNLTLAGFFEQVALLATRYGEVDPIDRAPFDHKLTIATVVVFIITGFFRRAALTSIFRTGGVNGPRTDARA